MLADSKKTKLTLVCIAVAFIAVAGALYINANRGSVGYDISSQTPAESIEATAGLDYAPGSGSIVAHVSGAVHNPGVYELPEGSRVIDFVNEAGGGTEEADLNAVNLAAKVTDSQKIIIPIFGEELPADAAGAENQGQGQGLININTASAAELKTLPGIGDARAEAIIAYRENNGAFTRPDDIKKVPGIGEGIFSGLKDLITH